MARKLVLIPQPIAVSQSMAANFVTAYSNLEQTDNASYQIIVTASGSSGQFFLDGSDDILTNIAPNPVNWVELMPCGTIAGADDKIIIDINQYPHAFIRLRYVSSVAGAGHCNINLTYKQIGG